MAKGKSEAFSVAYASLGRIVVSGGIPVPDDMQGLARRVFIRYLAEPKTAAGQESDPAGLAFYHQTGEWQLFASGLG
ncbi:hypothetical protein [Acidipila sp. EB88]|uniref:hypothetical protein n=1 Tax=Acidipila sp. EB88 TaxID=2305226 RepID=UPI000F5EBCD9|nr:hypothetical protein [Acidipila sp. EB88]